MKPLLEPRVAIARRLGMPDAAITEEGLQHAFAALKIPREVAVLRLRFGLDSPPATFRVIGQQFGVGAERIRQIEAKALRKLCHPSRGLTAWRPPVDG